MSFVVPSTNFRQRPPVWEIAQPFNTDAVGEIAYDSDPVVWARNHILACLLTNRGERVMRPTYGAGILNFVWDNDDPLTEAQIVNDVQQAIGTWEPSITIHKIGFVPQAAYSGVVNLDILFSVGPSTPMTVTVTLGGPGFTEIMAGAT